MKRIRIAEGEEKTEKGWNRERGKEKDEGVKGQEQEKRHVRRKRKG